MITPEQLAKSGTEDGHQSALFCWSGLNQIKYPPLRWFHAVRNDNHHKAIAQGVRSGVSDTFLPWPNLNFAGCYIEMKKPGRQKELNGGLSDKQIEFQLYAKSAGYFCAVCYSWQEARDTIINYLEGKL